MHDDKPCWAVKDGVVYEGFIRAWMQRPDGWYASVQYTDAAHYNYLATFPADHVRPRIDCCCHLVGEPTVVQRCFRGAQELGHCAEECERACVRQSDVTPALR